MKRVKKYLKTFMFYFGAFALTLTLVAGSKVALFFINRKPADVPIHSEDDVTEDNVVDVDYSSDRLNKTPMNVNYNEVKNVSPFSKTK